MIGDLTYCLLKINENLALLYELLTTYTPHYSSISYLPYLDKDDELSGVDQIQITTKTNNISPREICDIFSTFYAADKEEVSSKITLKFPGIIVMPLSAFEEVTACIDKINHYKNKFAVIYTNASKKDRFEKLHQAFPRLVTIQVTRAISYFQPVGKISNINFYWHHNVITKPCTKQDVLNKIHRNLSLNNNNHFLAQEQKLQNEITLNHYIHQLNAIPNEAKLRYHRNTGVPVPAANFHIQNINSKPQILNYKFSLPKFIFNYPDRITLLENYYRTNQINNNRQGKSRYTTIIPELGIEMLRR